MPIPEMPEELLKIVSAFGTIKWLMPLIATVEIISGILFIIPKTRALAAIMIFPILIGIVLHHYFYAPEGLTIAIPLFLIDIWAIIEHRRKYEVLIN